MVWTTTGLVKKKTINNWSESELDQKTVQKRSLNKCETHIYLLLWCKSHSTDQPAVSKELSVMDEHSGLVIWRDTATDTDTVVTQTDFNSPRVLHSSLTSLFASTVLKLSVHKLKVKGCPWCGLPMLGRPSTAVVRLWVTDRLQPDMWRGLSKSWCQSRLVRL